MTEQFHPITSQRSSSHTQELIASYHLGTLVSEYTKVEPKIRDTFVRELVGLFLSLSLLLISIVVSIVVIIVVNFTLVTAFSWMALVSVIAIDSLISIAIISGIYLLYKLTIANYFNRHLYIVVGTSGLILIRGRHQEVIYWDQIDTVWQAIYAQGLLISYTVRLKNGKAYRFGKTIQKVRDLGRTIAHEVAQRQLPGVAKKYDEGKELAFAPLHVSKKGIRKGKKNIPWDQIRTFDVERGFVIIQKKGERESHYRLSVPVAKIPNFFVFTSLVHHILEANPDSTS